MRISESKLKRIILEEAAKIENRPVVASPGYINSIIKEELELHRKRKSLQERKLKRRRIQETARKLRRARILRGR